MAKKPTQKTRRVTDPEQTDQKDVPVREHYHGERVRDEQSDGSRDIEEETLDRDAPYNKTYGLKVDE